MASDSNMHVCMNNRHYTAALTVGGRKHDPRYTSQTGICGQCMNLGSKSKILRVNLQQQNATRQSTAVDKLLLHLET